MLGFREQGRAPLRFLQGHCICKSLGLTHLSQHSFEQSSNLVVGIQLNLSSHVGKVAQVCFNELVAHQQGYFVPHYLSSEVPLDHQGRFVRASYQLSTVDEDLKLFGPAVSSLDPNCCPLPQILDQIVPLEALDFAPPSLDPNRSNLLPLPEHLLANNNLNANR